MTGAAGLIKATGLWAKTSARGNAYMVGRLGGVRVYVFENRDRQSEDDPTHLLMFGDGSPATAAPAAAPRQPAAPTRRQHRRQPAPRSPASCPTGDPSRPFDDPIPDFSK